MRAAGWLAGREAGKAGWLARTQALLAGARRLPPGTCLLCSRRAEAAAAARAYSGVFFPILIDGAGKPKGGACSGRGGPADTAARPPACQPGTPAYVRAHWLRFAAAAARNGHPACQSPARGGGAGGGSPMPRRLPVCQGLCEEQ